MSRNWRWLESPPAMFADLPPSTPQVLFFFSVLGFLSPHSFLYFKGIKWLKGSEYDTLLPWKPEAAQLLCGCFFPSLSSWYSIRVEDFYQVEIWAFEIFPFSSSLCERGNAMKHFLLFWDKVPRKCQVFGGKISCLVSETCSYFV